MNTPEQIPQIFKTPTSAEWLRLGGIVGGAILLIVVLQRLLPWLAGRLHGKRRLNLLAVTPLVRLIVILTAVVLSIPLLIKPSMQNMVALLGTVGVALGFALKDYVGSLLAGIVAIGERPYRNGDWVQIGGAYGEVRHLGIRTVNLVTPDDTRVTIPHAKLWTEAVFNANNGSPRMQCVADFYLHPQHDAAQVRSTLTDIALTSPYLYFDHPVAVIAREKPWGTHYQLKAYPVDSAQQFRFISDLTVRGKAALAEQGARFAAVPVTAEGAGRKS